MKEWKTVERRLRIVSEYWGNLRLDEISTAHFARLDAYLRGLDPPRAPKTINHYIGMLKTMFNFAIRQKLYIGENPAKEVKPYVVDESRRAYNQEELAQILQAAGLIEKEAWRNTALQPYARRIVLILLYTGMRLGELLNLRWNSIMDDKITLRRTETKQRQEKVIPLTADLRSVLDSLKDRRRREDSYVIPRYAGQPSAVSPKSLLAKIREYSGITDFTLHGLRHTAATIMVSEALGRGVGLSDIMKVLGHSKVETTMRYLHSNLESMRKAVEILGGIVKMEGMESGKENKDGES